MIHIIIFITVVCTLLHLPVMMHFIRTRGGQLPPEDKPQQPTHLDPL